LKIIGIGNEITHIFLGRQLVEIINENEVFSYPRVDKHLVLIILAAL